MRPEKAKRTIRRTIERYLNDEPTAMYIPDMLRAVYTLQSKQAIWHQEHDFAIGDYLPKIDKDYKDIEEEMMYISDRFNAPHILAWLAVGIEEGLF